MLDLNPMALSPSLILPLPLLPSPSYPLVPIVQSRDRVIGRYQKAAHACAVTDRPEIVLAT